MKPLYLHLTPLEFDALTWLLDPEEHSQMSDDHYNALCRVRVKLSELHTQHSECEKLNARFRRTESD